VTDIATQIEFPPVLETGNVGAPLAVSSDGSELVEEILVEEVSIDGMGGVY